MAVLSKNGTEILRVSRDEPVNDKTRSITWQRKTYSYRSNGKVLVKYDVRFRPDLTYPDGQNHTYGWKVKGTIKKGANLKDCSKSWSAKGWTVEVDNTTEKPFGIPETSALLAKA